MWKTSWWEQEDIGICVFGDKSAFLPVESSRPDLLQDSIAILETAWMELK